MKYLKIFLVLNFLVFIPLVVEGFAVSRDHWNLLTYQQLNQRPGFDMSFQEYQGLMEIPHYRNLIEEQGLQRAREMGYNISVYDSSPVRGQETSNYYDDLRRSQQMFEQRQQNQIDPDGHVNFPTPPPSSPPDISFLYEDFSSVNEEEEGGIRILWPDDAQLPDDFNPRDYISMQNSSGSGPNINTSGGGSGPNINTSGGGSGPNINTLGGGSGPNINTLGGGGVLRLQNPIRAGNFEEFLNAIISIVVQIGVPVVALGIIYSGFLFVTAGGNTEKLNLAKQTFLYTLIGAAIVLGAFVISAAIQGTVDQLR